MRNNSWYLELSNLVIDLIVKILGINNYKNKYYKNNKNKGCMIVYISNFQRGERSHILSFNLIDEW